MVGTLAPIPTTTRSLTCNRRGGSRYPASPPTSASRPKARRGWPTRRASFTSSPELPQRVAPLALGAQRSADAANLGVPVAQRLGTGVHGVVAEEKVIRMRGRGTDHEPRVALGDEVDRFFGGLEDGDLRGVDARRRPQRPIEHRCPGYR